MNIAGQIVFPNPARGSKFWALGLTAIRLQAAFKPKTLTKITVCAFKFFICDSPAMTPDNRIVPHNSGESRNPVTEINSKFLDSFDLWLLDSGFRRGMGL